jgi:hypothetical protein
MYFCIISLLKLAVFVAVVVFIFNILKQNVPELKAIWDKLNDPRGEKAYLAKKLADKKRDLEEYQKLAGQTDGLEGATKTIRRVRKTINKTIEE